MWRGRIWSARPMIVVQDEEEQRILYTPNGIRLVVAGRDGTKLRLPEATWDLLERTWTKGPILSFSWPSAGHAILLFFHRDWTPWVWYVNVEAPLRRPSSASIRRNVSSTCWSRLTGRAGSGRTRTSWSRRSWEVCSRRPRRRSSESRPNAGSAGSSTGSRRSTGTGRPGVPIPRGRCPSSRRDGTPSRVCGDGESRSLGPPGTVPRAGSNAERPALRLRRCPRRDAGAGHGDRGHGRLPAHEQRERARCIRDEHRDGPPDRGRASRGRRPPRLRLR